VIITIIARWVLPADTTRPWMTRTDKPGARLTMQVPGRGEK
jgi:hypothetical protein